MWLLRNARLYHYLACDVPCLFTAIALVQSTSSMDPESPAACGGHIFGDNTVKTATALIWCKVVLLMWSTFSTLSQLLLTGQFVTRVITTSGDDAAADIVMQSTMSILMTSARSRLTDEWRRENTTRWVAQQPQSTQSRFTTVSLSTTLLGGAAATSFAIPEPEPDPEPEALSSSVYCGSE